MNTLICVFFDLTLLKNPNFQNFKDLKFPNFQKINEILENFESLKIF